MKKKYIIKIELLIEILFQKYNKKLKNITQSGLSQHLSIMKANDLLDSNKEGLNITYFVKDEKIKNVLQVLKDSYSKEN